MQRIISRWASAFLLVLGSLSMSSAEVTIEQSVTGLEVSEATIKSGMDLFKANCSACHALDRRMTGPALAGIHERREMDWLIKWIRNNQELRESGDPEAIAIYNEYNGAAMNLFTGLSDEEIKSIIMYVENGGWSDAPKEEATGGTEVAKADPSLVKKINWMLLIIALIIGVIFLLIVRNIDLVSKYTGKSLIPWNNVNAGLMILFLIAFLGLVFYEFSIHGKYILINDSSSEHGARLDQMMMITFAITMFVFVVTQILLFWFAFRYRAKKGVKALFYPDNDKLELIWTIVPAIVLTVLVIGGLNAWRSIMKPAPEGTAEIEVFAEQFKWTVRYPGADGELGNSNYNLISGTNPLGVAVEHEAKALLKDLQKDIANYEKTIAGLPEDLGELKGSVGGLVGKDEKIVRKQIEAIESGDRQSELELQIRRRKTQIRRINEALEGGVFFTEASMDDIVGQEIHLIVNEPITFKFRSRDVIHSALMKEFRAQMNVVPGLPTNFTLTPTKTTEMRRKELKNPEFDYNIVCNKICGNSHFNMKLKLIVETREQYEEWMRSQTATFVQAEPETDEGLEEVAPESGDATDEGAEGEENTAEPIAMNIQQ